MNYLKRGKENRSSDYCQNKRVVYDIFFCYRVVKTSDQFHYTLLLFLEFNNVLPSLVIRDQIKPSHQKNELNFIYLIFKMIGDSHE